MQAKEREMTMNVDELGIHRREILRKLVHFSAIILPLYFVQLSYWELKFFLLFLLVITLFLDWGRNKIKFLQKIISPLAKFLLREDELHHFTGASYLVISVFLVFILFPKWIAAFSLFFLTVGDAASSLVPRMLGQRSKEKNLLGSVAFLSSALLISVIIPQLSLPVKLVGAISATLLEAIKIRVNDNISVPIGSSIFMGLTERIWG